MDKRIISADQKSILPDFKAILSYKDLFVTLTWRDFKVRYAQAALGFLWAIIQPVITLLLLSLVFGKFVGVDTGNIPHIVFTVVGTSIWTYFSFVMTNAGNSIITSQGMVKKIYFPRLIIPLSKAIVGLIDFIISIGLLIVLMIYYKIVPSPNFGYFFIFLFFGMLAALAMGIWLSALTVRYRDFQYIVPFIVQIGLYLTPIGYPAEFAIQKLPTWAQPLYYLNPLAGIVQGMRWALFGGNAPDNLIYISLSIVLLLFIGSLLYFKRIEDNIADFV